MADKIKAQKHRSGRSSGGRKRVTEDDGPGSSSRSLWAAAHTESRYHADEVMTRGKRATKKSLDEKLKKK